MSGSDDQRVARAVAGDETAITALLECHGLHVRAALERSYRRRLHGQVDLDDVMQVTYLEAFLRIRSFIPGGPHAFEAWLRRIAENNIRDAIRKADGDARRCAAGPCSSVSGGGNAFADPVACTGTPSRVAGKDESRGLLEAALRQLPEDYERVIRLYDLEGHSGPEVARLMGRSHGAIKMLVARARDRLGELLGSESRYFSRDS